MVGWQGCLESRLRTAVNWCCRLAVLSGLWNGLEKKRTAGYRTDCKLSTSYQGRFINIIRLEGTRHRPLRARARWETGPVEQSWQLTKPPTRDWSAAPTLLGTGASLEDPGSKGLQGDYMVVEVVVVRGK